MKKMIVSALLAGTFLFGAAYAQTTTPATKPAANKEVQATPNSGSNQGKKAHKAKGKKHGAKKADANNAKAQK